MGHSNKNTAIKPDESKVDDFVEEAKDFLDRTVALNRKYKEKYGAGKRERPLSSSLFLKLRPSHKEHELHGELELTNDSRTIVKNLPRQFLTSRQRLDLLEVNLKKYKTTHPKVYSTGYRVFSEASDLLDTPLTIREKISLNNSLDSAIELVKEPNKHNLDRVHIQAIVALGHESTSKKYTGALLALVGAVTTSILLFVAPPVSLLGFGLFVGGACLYKKSEAASMAKSLNDLEEVSQRAFNL